MPAFQILAEFIRRVSMNRIQTNVWIILFFYIFLHVTFDSTLLFDNFDFAQPLINLVIGVFY